MASAKPLVPDKQKDSTLDSSPTAASDDIMMTVLALYNNRDFDACRDILYELIGAEPENLGHLYNLLVTEFRCNDCKNSNKFLEEFTNLSKKADIEFKKLKKEHYLVYPAIIYNLMVILLHRKESDMKVALKIAEQIIAMNKNSTVSDTIIDYELQKILKMVRLMEIYLLISSQLFQKALKSIEVLESLIFLPDGQAEPENEKIKIKLQQYKVLCFLSIRCLTSGRTESKRLFNMTGINSSKSYIGACLKAYYDYLKRNYKKASKTMSTLESTFGKNENEYFKNTGDNLPAIFRNNLGCCSVYMNMPHTAMVHFKSALEKSRAVNLSKGPGELPIYCSDRDMCSTKILYNCGVTLVLMKRGQEAFPLLMYSLSIFYNNSRLWLRAAEACILVHNSTPAGWTLRHRNPYMPNSLKAYDEAKSAQTDSQDWSKIKPTLEFALHCLENAVICLACDPCEGVSVRPSDPIKDSNVYRNLYAAITCASTYVAFKLKNYPLAIKKGIELLSLENVQGVYSYLAKQYVGMAYLKSGDVENALSYLSMEEKYDVSVVSESERVHLDEEVSVLSEMYPKDSSLICRQCPNSDWAPSTEFEARALREYDLCVALVERRDFPSAWKVLKVWVTKFSKYLPPKFVKLAIFINLKLRDRHTAVNLLKLNPYVFDDGFYMWKSTCAKCSTLDTSKNVEDYNQIGDNVDRVFSSSSS